MPYARLVAEQSRDDQTWHLHSNRRVVCATDLGSRSEPDAGWKTLHAVTDYRSPSVLVGESMVWGPDEVSFCRGKTCRACGGRLRRGHTCLVCSASHDDPRQWPVATAPPLAKRVAARLKGGVGMVA